MSISDWKALYFQATEAVSEVTGDGSGQISWCLQLEIQEQSFPNGILSTRELSGIPGVCQTSFCLAASLG